MARIPLIQGGLVPRVQTNLTGAAQGYLLGQEARQNRELNAERLRDIAEGRQRREGFRTAVGELGPDATDAQYADVLRQWGSPEAFMNFRNTMASNRRADERLAMARRAEGRAISAANLAQTEKNRKRTGAINFAVSEGLADTPEQAAMLYDAGFMDEKFEASLRQPKPLTNIGKINRAIETGEITPEQGAVMKANELAGEEVTTKARNDARRADTSAKTITKELDKFETLFDKEGFAGPTSLGAKRRYATARRGIQLQLKELFNLGVLNGPDLALMDQMILDPSSAEAAALAATGQLESTMKDNLNQVRTMIESIRKNAVAGVPGFEGATGEVQRRFRFNPETGTLE